MNKERLIWADLLRISACITVIAIHTSAQFYYTCTKLSVEWWIAVIINSFGHFAVPSFFMLSGMFMLNAEREVSIKHIYTRSIPKMLELILYSVVFSFGVFIIHRILGKNIEYVNEAPIHTIYWIMILYFLTPALRCIAKERKILEYTLIVLVVLSMIISPIRYSYISGISTVVYEANKLLVSVTFFLLGYYLSVVDTKNISLFWLVAGIVVSYFIYFLELYEGLNNMEFVLVRIDHNSVIQFNTLCISVCTYLLFKNYVSKLRFKEMGRKMIGIVGISTMYIYVSHMGMLKLLNSSGFLRNHYIQDPVWIVVNFLMCTVVSIVYIAIKRWILDKLKRKNFRRK